jgi:ubiquinone/menaquinone biosynthesis C-methylase UbiE
MMIEMLCVVDDFPNFLATNCTHFIKMLAMSSKKTGVAPEYLHGFSSTEQERLYKQARFLEESVYQNIDFSDSKKLIEVGCGVGAQTEILLERFPHLHITGVDASEAQLKTATARLQGSPEKSRVDFFQADALHLQFKDDSFDSAFICWFLEHVQEPVEF